MKKLIALLLTLTLALSMTACSAIISLPFTPAESESDGPEVSFTFIAVGPDGKEETFHVTTTKETVGEALQEQGLISGEEGDYGLYIKTVNGITLDYDKDGMYWSFYVGEEYALAGVDQTPIEDGATYSIKAETA